MPRAAISLDPRLTALADLCPACRLFADIGTDHGRLGAYLLQVRRCDRALLTDISTPSLEKARKLIGALSLTDRAEFFVGNGALALPESPDVAVIAGMGGETIADIVELGKSRLGSARLLLQPNVAQKELRLRLTQAGYAISDERIVRDGRRLYLIVAAEPGEMLLDDRSATIGPVLMRTRPETLFDYAAFRLRVCQKALAGVISSGCQDPALSQEIALWQEVSQWQKQD